MSILSPSKSLLLIAAILMLAPAALVAASNDAQNRSDIHLPVKDYLLPVKTEDIRESLKDPIFVACKENAMPVGKEGFLGVCTRYDDISGQTDTIIYDSTDQILLPPTRRSQEWLKMALAMATKAPFGIAGFDVEQIANHYYRVVFTDANPDFWGTPTNVILNKFK